MNKNEEKMTASGHIMTIPEKTLRNDRKTTWSDPKMTVSYQISAVPKTYQQ